MRNKENTPKKQKRSVVLPLFVFILLLIAFLCFFAGRWYLEAYGDLGFDSVLFTLMSSLGGVQSGLVSEFMTDAAVPALLWTLAFTAAFLLLCRVGSASRVFAGVTAVVLSLLLLGHAAVTTGFPEYIRGLFVESELFETHYVDPASVRIAFPKEKRNLIYIFLESMETTYFSTGEGGAEDVNLIPELYALAKENVNFSQNSGVGGFRSASGTTWTIGAMVGHSGGVPLKTPDDVEDWQNGYGEDGIFLPGLVSLSDILHEQGYYQSLMVGSVASFGGRKTYYETHGTDMIYELTTARKDGIVPGDYFVWWGMEDKYLFEYAKQELTEISQKDQPFAFTMLTVDTHHIGGYLCELCGEDHDEQYENVISCSSRQVLDFVRWIQQQPFYENTTIVITGDHPSMDNGYFERNVPEDYTRRIYNCFINAAATPKKEKNRQFNTLDMFPTTLAAMGCTIGGNRLGLGTNLFAGIPTLTERMGFEKLDNQIALGSDYYAQVFRQEEVEGK